MSVYAIPVQAFDEHVCFSVTSEDGAELLVMPPGCTDFPTRFDGFMYLPWEAEAIICAPITPKTLIPEALAGGFPQNPVLISSQLCGGRLEERLQDALEIYGDRVFFLIDPMRHLVPLPCPNAEPILIGSDESKELRHRFPSFYTDAFCCQYCVDTDAKGVHLFDTDTTIEKKLHIAQSLGIENILILPT